LLIIVNCIYIYYVLIYMELEDDTINCNVCVCGVYVFKCVLCE
jgi:hypothetical protein